MESSFELPKEPVIRPDVGLHPDQVRIFTKMTPEDKLRLAERLYFAARELKRAGLRLQHPHWSENAIEARLREIFLEARS